MLHSTQISSKAGTVAVIGVLQIIGGVILSFIFGVVGIFHLVRSLFWLGAGIGGVLTMAIFLVGGILLVKRGVENLVLADGCRKLAKIIGNADRVQLEALAKVMHCTQDKAANQIRVMMAREIVPEGYFDLQSREFIVGKPPAQPEEEKTLREVKSRSSLPLVLFLGFWALYFVFFARTGLPFFWALVLSLVVYAVARISMPAKTKVVVERASGPKPKQVKVETGDSAVDDMLKEAHGYVNQMTEYNRRITEQRINSRVARLIEVAREILTQLSGNPEKARSARQFLNYYLPTTVKLLENYEILARQTVKGENISDTLRKIDEMLDTLVKAYEKELDDLFRDKAMDVSADIAVMQNMLKQGGLVDDFFGKQQN